MTLALVDYGAGNLQSVSNALKAAGAEDVIVTDDPEVVLRADRVVLPGVGAFAHCMNALASIDGMVQTIDAVASYKPFLGICVGMQLMAEYGCEHGTHNGLGLVAGYVNPLTPKADVKVPHMGWNKVTPVGPKSLIEPGEAYFLHSYAYVCGQWPSAVRAVTDHGGEIVAAIQAGPAIGVQFHPEKSQAYGLAFLARFLAWKP